MEYLVSQADKDSNTLNNLKDTIGSRYIKNEDGQLKFEYNISADIKKIFELIYGKEAVNSNTEIDITNDQMNKLKDLIGSILKENYKNFDKKTDETNADIGTLGKASTTNLIEKIRTELTNLRKFIGYDVIDTVDDKTGQYKLEAKNYDSVFGYVSNPKDGEVTTLLDYIKIFVSDKTDQNNAIESLQNTLGTINSKLTQLENDLKECAKSADLSKYVKSTELGNYNTKDEIQNTYVTKTGITSYMANYAEASTVFNLRKDLEDNYAKKVDLPSDSVTVTANNFTVSRDTDSNIKIDLADTNLFPGYKIYLSDNIGDLGKTQPGGNNGWLLQNSSDGKYIYITLIKDSKLTRFIFTFLNNKLWSL